MKKLLGIIIIALVVASCEEVPPPINYQKSTQTKDSTYIKLPAPAPQQKHVLLEDVSGVKCVNCPDAAIIAKSILTAFPGRAFTTVMHPDIPALANFVSPITKAGHESRYDFRTKDASDILQLVGIPGSLPSGFVNRKKFAGQQSRILGRAEWYAKCQEELNGTTPVNIELSNTFDEASGEGTVNVKLTYTQTLNKKHYLSILLVEDSIVDTQEYQDPVTFDVLFDNNYVHNHVLRDVVTNATGDPLTTDPAVTLVPGRVFEKNFGYKMNVSDKIKVNPKKAHLIVFVHEDADGIDVIQVDEIGVSK